MKEWIKIEKIPEVLAVSYEKAARLAIDSYYGKVSEEVVSNVSQGLLLDLGTGPGYLPIEIVKRNPKINIVGVDLCRKLIRIARTNAAAAGFSHQLNFETGNASRLRFNDAVFDMILSTGMLHSLTAPIAVFKEIFRLLKKNAEAWIYDPADVVSGSDREEWRNSLTFQDKFFLNLFKIFGLHKPIKPFTRKQVVPIIEAAGFRQYTIDERDGEIKIILTKLAADSEDSR